jgi:hypothetical protein
MISLSVGKNNDIHAAIEKGTDKVIQKAHKTPNASRIYAHSYNLFRISSPHSLYPLNCFWSFTVKPINEIKSLPEIIVSRVRSHRGKANELLGLVHAEQV